MYHIKCHISIMVMYRYVFDALEGAAVVGFLANL